MQKIPYSHNVSEINKGTATEYDKTVIIICMLAKIVSKSLESFKNFINKLSRLKKLKFNLHSYIKFKSRALKF